MSDDTGGIKGMIEEADRIAFENSLPMSLDQLKSLLRLLARNDAPECDHTFRDTLTFVSAAGLDQVAVTSWLREHGGHCDCEVIYNVYDAVGDRIGWCLDV
jgi:hypothetical protein